MTADSSSGSAVALVERLSAGLGDAKVSYCHWKSNEAIDRSLSADNDLDLLVDPADFGRFLEVATGLGFRLALPSPSRQIPGHLALYGLDVDTNRLVQIDAQTRLVIGDDMTKNYRLPIERAYLSGVDISTSLPLPRPEFEYLVFVLRMVLKHCPWDAQLSYKARLTASEQRELLYLEERVDQAEVERLRSLHLPVVSADLLERCRQALGRELGPGARAAIARRLAGALAGYGRRPPSADTVLKVYRRLAGRLLGHLWPWAGKKRVAGGGLVIAIVGGDGSGKTSAVTDLETFLRRHFRTRRFHLGKPRPSPVSRLARALLRRTSAGGPPSGLPPWEAAELVGFPGYAYLLTHFLTARDRYRTHLAARRAAARGAIVVCDRFPLPGLETMDCPRLQRLQGMEHRAVARWLTRQEGGYYRRLQQPDAVIVLKVEPGVAAVRRGDQDREFVRRRAAEIYERDWKEPNVYTVDAGRPIKQVHKEVRALAWSLL